MTSRNPFPSPTPLQKVMLTELAKVAERCYARGWSWGTAGNFSIRGSDGIIWQSPTGLCKGELRPDLFVPVDLAMEKPVESYTQRPSAEMPVHAGVYKAVSDAMCVVHTHPSESVAISFEVDDFRFCGDEMSKALGLKSHLDEVRIPILENPTPEQMVVFSSKVKAGISPPVKIVFLKGHGAYAWGKTPLEALAYLEALEFLCQRRRRRTS